MTKKTLLTTLIVLGCLLGAGELRAATEIGGIYYNLYGTAYNPNYYAQVTYNSSSYNSYSGDVVIPSSIEYNNITYPVTQIGASAFRNCTGLTSVSIPEGITSIGDYAFYGCNNSSFRSITLPSTVTSIASSNAGRAFYNCTYLESINIPSGVTNIPQYSFYGCAALSSIIIPSGVTTITSYSFNRCSSLTSIILPASITTIESSAFYLCTNLASVTVLGNTPPSLNNAAVFQRSYTSGDFPTNFYVLKGSGDTYKAADYWSTYSSRISELSSISFVNLDLTNSVTELTIPSEVVLTVTGTLTNTDASKLVIADGGQLISNNAVSATLQKDIAAATNWSTESTGWYTIASPVAGAAVGTATTGNYDLYSYVESACQWYNQKAHSSTFTTFAEGIGYLYANEEGKTINFAGDMKGAYTTITVEDLSFAAAKDNVKGYNLVGNPFTRNLTGSDIQLNGTAITSYLAVAGGNELVSYNIASNPIKPGQGFFVQATGENQDLVFNPSAKGGNYEAKPSIINIEAGNADFMDRALVQIGGGNTLRKITINDNVSHVYVMNDGKDYAAATIAEFQNDMPVYFQAAQDGQYTITVNAEKVEMEYMHLIDNMTGADIDLLATPTYTFNAKTTDYASRFRLVFNANNNTSEDSASTSSATFAFFNGSEWQIANTGRATLQVVDVTGRVLRSETVEGEATLSLNEVPGVYVMRLVKGESVKTQKIVVR